MKLIFIRILLMRKVTIFLASNIHLESLAGVGTINGHLVKCISPEWMVKFHTGYKLDENDYHDVLALCEHFGIPLPSEYENFQNK